MKIKLSNILSVPARCEEMEVELGISAISLRGYDYEILEKSPFHLKLTNLGNQKLHIEGSINIKLGQFCDRCLAEVPKEYDITIDRRLCVSEDEGNTDLEDVSYIKEYNLDVDMLVYEEVALRLPSKVLCKEDCKGICPVCGTNLNHNECGCNRKVPDPRMSNVLDIFNNHFKEV